MIPTEKAMYAAPPIANLIVLRSTDIHRAAKFYQQMGLLFTLHCHGGGPDHYTSTVCDFVFEIYPSRNENDTTHGTRIGFNVDAVDGIVEMLREIEVEIVSEPKDSPHGRRAVVRDFDGHIVELLTPPNRDQN